MRGHHRPGEPERVTAARPEPIVVVRTGRAGRYADWRAASELPGWWQRQALGGGVGGVFFPVEDEPAPARDRRERIAEAICAACPVREPCAVHALAHRELHGVWGGLSEADRRHRLAHP
jgi:WhiB family redox-sensing transcriptional regulator